MTKPVNTASTPPLPTPRPKDLGSGHQSAKDVHDAGGVLAGEKDQAGAAPGQGRVSQLQQKMHDLGYLEKDKGDFKPTGKSDDKLATAVKQYQHDHQLKEDGVVGKDTAKSLGDAIQKKKAEGAKPKDPAAADPAAPAKPAAPAAEAPKDSGGKAAEVTNSEAKGLVPKQPDGTVDRAALDKMPVQERREIMKGLEKGRVETNAEEDKAKTEVANSLLRTNPEALKPEDAATLNRGLRGFGEAQAPQTQDQANAQLDKLDPATREAFRTQSQKAGANEQDEATWGRMAASDVRTSADPAGTIKQLQASTALGHQGNDNKALAAGMTDGDLKKLASTPAGKQALTDMYNNSQGVMYNDKTQQAQRARLAPYVFSGAS